MPLEFLPVTFKEHEMTGYGCTGCLPRDCPMYYPNGYKRHDDMEEEEEEEVNSDEVLLLLAYSL